MIFLLCLFALALAEPSINDAYFCKRENAEQTLKVGAWSSDPSSFDGPIELLNIKPAYKTKVEKALRGREVDRVNGRHCCFHAMSDGAFGGDVLCKVEKPSINDAYFCKRENAEQTLKVGAWSSDPSSFDGPIELLNIKPAYKTKVEKALRGREVDRVNGRHCCFHAMSDGAFGGDVLCKVTGLEETAFDGY